jgi:hypothetical protein
MWFVVVHSNKDIESKVIGKFNTRTNAQLFAEEHVIQTVLNHNGSGIPCDAVSRKYIEQKLNDLSITNENRYYIIRNNYPWGATVNNVHIRQQETTTVDEVDATETHEVETIVKVPKHVSIAGGWFSRAKTYTIEEDTTVKVPKQITVKQARVTTASKRIAESNDVFTCIIVYDDTSNDWVELARQERILSTNDDRARCKLLASRIASTCSFKTFDGVSTVSVKFCKKEFTNEFDTFKSYKAVNDMGKLLNKIQQESKLFPMSIKTNTFAPPLTDGFDLDVHQRKNIIKPSPAPVKSSHPGSALAHLNDDIIARHRDMFSGIKPKPVEKVNKNGFDDETIDNLCNEIERAVKAASRENNKKDVESNQDGWDDTSDTWSESEEDSEELNELRLSTDDIYGPDEINS